MNGVPATLVYTVAVSPSTLARNDELAGRGDPDIVGLLLDTVVDGFWVAVDPAVGLVVVVAAGRDDIPDTAPPYD